MISWLLCAQIRSHGYRTTQNIFMTLRVISKQITTTLDIEISVTPILFVLLNTNCKSHEYHRLIAGVVQNNS